MKFWEAMKALEEGKKVRAKYWSLDAFVEKSDHFLILPTMVEDEWEIYQEPQKTYSFQEMVERSEKTSLFVFAG